MLASRGRATARPCRGLTAVGHRPQTKRINQLTAVHEARLKKGDVFPPTTTEQVRGARPQATAPPRAHAEGPANRQ